VRVSQIIYSVLLLTVADVFAAIPPAVHCEDSASSVNQTRILKKVDSLVTLESVQARAMEKDREDTEQEFRWLGAPQVAFMTMFVAAVGILGTMLALFYQDDNLKLLLDCTDWTMFGYTMRQHLRAGLVLSVVFGGGLFVFGLVNGDHVAGASILATFIWFLFTAYSAVRLLALVLGMRPAGTTPTTGASGASSPASPPSTGQAVAVPPAP